MRTILGAVAVSLCVAACAKGRGDDNLGPGSDKPPDYIRYDPGKTPLAFIKVETVAQSSTATAVTLPARVAFDEDHTQRVASPVDGRAVAILVKLGDRVRAGQPLIRLSSANVGQIQADAQKAGSDLTLAQKSVERVHKLQAEGAVADKDVAQAESDLRKARSDYARASAQLKVFGVSASDPEVNAALRAQIGGVVVDRNVLVGQEVRADQASPLLTISSLDAVWVLADVYEQDLGLVAVGDPVSVSVPAYPGEQFRGQLSHVGDVIDPATHTVKIRCVVPNPDHKLKPDMFAEVDVHGNGKQAVIYEPSRAVLSDGDKSYVILAADPNSFRMRSVSVGPEVDGKVRILSGLSPGERLVTDGAIFMKREIETR
jgi:membrane fusion protein, heavy metal efflux system